MAGSFALPTYRSTLSELQVSGYIVAFLGVLAYNYVKSQTFKPSQPAQTNPEVEQEAAGKEDRGTTV
jgi:hypothetical protein